MDRCATLTMVPSSLLFLFSTAALAINNQPARFKDVDLEPCDQWDKFIFGNQGDFSHIRYHIRNETPLALRLTDAFCLGDEFIVYDWNKRLGVVRMPYDKSLNHHGPRHLCKRPEADPQKAWDCGRFASRQFMLRPGRHRITIKSLSSPIGAGYGFVKLMVPPACTKPCHDCDDEGKHPDSPHCSSRLVVVPCKVGHSEAASTCTQKGMALAAITSTNFDQAAQLIYDRVGSNGRAWIASYNGDNYGQACLGFTVGASLPSGNINIQDCNVPAAVLCQNIH